MGGCVCTLFAAGVSWITEWVETVGLTTAVETEDESSGSLRFCWLARDAVLGLAVDSARRRGEPEWEVLLESIEALPREPELEHGRCCLTCFSGASEL